jgi:hypothetical protein
MRKVTINVTQHDIDVARRQRNNEGESYWDVMLKCPVARAAARIRALRDFRGAGYGAIYAFGSVIPTPVSVRAFMREFDAGRNVAPFHFTVNVPDE